MAGNIGSRAAQDYTVIGDTVNLASRLEGAAKAYGTRTLVSEDTLLATRGTVLARELDLLRVKGKQQPVRVFELVGVAGTPRSAAPGALRRGPRALPGPPLCRGPHRLPRLPGDGPSQQFAARCEALLASPPPEGWDGVFTLDSK